jgi:hypothetical protein
MSPSKPPKGYRITFRNEKPAKGLAAIGQGELGREAYVNGKLVGVIDKKGGKGESPLAWYWYTISNDVGIKSKNTASQSHPGTAEGKQKAEAELKAFIIECLEVKSNVQDQG